MAAGAGIHLSGSFSGAGAWPSGAPAAGWLARVTGQGGAGPRAAAEL
jgi:hypothetical protein